MSKTYRIEIKEKNRWTPLAITDVYGNATHHITAVSKESGLHYLEIAGGDSYIDLISNNQLRLIQTTVDKALLLDNQTKLL